jgi:aminoglycoside/choline kinase family phosphotransferase
MSLFQGQKLGLLGLGGWMYDRADLIRDFVAKTVWKNWQPNPVPGDASARRYWRLTDGKQTVILMDDAPELGGSTVPFATIAQLLKSHGLSAPHILAHDPDNGLMVISDLGNHDVAAWLRAHPEQEMGLYQTSVDVLVKLHRITPPDDLDRMTAQSGADMLDLVGAFYSRADITDLQHQMLAALEVHAPITQTLALRDFHAENLIWRNAHKGLDRVGLLDFQDAFVAPAGYDLVSLLRDARRDVGQDTAETMITYFSEQISAGPGFRTQLACVAIQRNLRILGIFGRLSLKMGKAQYLDLIPRVWGHILTDLEDPKLVQLRQAVLDTVPAPTEKLLAGLKP